MNNIADLRREIDEIDDKIAELFLKRMDKMDEVALAKKTEGASISDPARERHILSRVTNAVGESEMVYKLVRLFGSAFVISVAEELFFRRWLMRFAGFWWMVALFAVEHDRWLVGAIAGVLYGWLALRKGLVSAIVAHVTTNLALGLYVLETGKWQFW